jgi:hypothetical protein
MSRPGLVFALCGMFILRAESGLDASGSDLTIEANGGVAETEPADKNGSESDHRNGLIWVDQSQQWVTEALFQRMVWFDSMFYENPEARSEDPRSRFRVKVFGSMDLENPSRPSPDIELFASVRFPGLRDRFRIVLDSEELDAFPGRGPDEQSDRTRLALRRIGRWVDTDVGAKLGSTPRMFTRLITRQNWNTGDVVWSANQRGFYDTDEGFGTLGSLSQHIWPWTHFILGHNSSVRWSESTTGVEWQDSLFLAYVPKLIESTRHGQFVGYSDTADCLGLRLNVRGLHNGSHEMESYRAAIVYRRQLFNRNYLYFEMVPEVEWARGNDWEPVYTVRAGLDILFWRDLQGVEY